jgi:hypothetical protein
MKKYPDLSPYAFVKNSPIIYKDPDGREAIVTITENRDANGNVTGGSISIKAVVYITGKEASESVAIKAQEKVNSIYKSGVYESNGQSWKIDFDVKVEYVKSDGIEDFMKNHNSKLDASEANVLDADGKTDRSHVTGFMPRNGVKHLSKLGRLDSKGGVGYKSTVIAHEIGHLLGLLDRYSDTEDDEGNTVSKPHEGWDGDLMSDGFPRLDQTHYDNWGRVIVDKFNKSGHKKFTLGQFVDFVGLGTRPLGANKADEKIKEAEKKYKDNNSKNKKNAKKGN